MSNGKKKIKLSMPLHTFERLHREVDRGRGKKVVVDRGDLLKLMIDHSTVLRELEEDSNYEITEPKFRYTRENK